MTREPDAAGIVQLFRERVDGVGWVVLELWPDGLKLRVSGHYVYEHAGRRCEVPKPTVIK